MENMPMQPSTAAQISLHSRLTFWLSAVATSAVLWLLANGQQSDERWYFVIMGLLVFQTWILFFKKSWALSLVAAFLPAALLFPILYATEGLNEIMLAAVVLTVIAFVPSMLLTYIIRHFVQDNPFTGAIIGIATSLLPIAAVAFLRGNFFLLEVMKHYVVVGVGIVFLLGISILLYKKYKSASHIHITEQENVLLSSTSALGSQLWKKFSTERKLRKAALIGSVCGFLAFFSNSFPGHFEILNYPAKLFFSFFPPTTLQVSIFLALLFNVIAGASIAILIVVARESSLLKTESTLWSHLRKRRWLFVILIASYLLDSLFLGSHDVVTLFINPILATILFFISLWGWLSIVGIVVMLHAWLSLLQECESIDISLLRKLYFRMLCGFLLILAGHASVDAVRLPLA